MADIMSYSKWSEIKEVLLYNPDLIWISPNGEIGYL